MNAKLNRRAFLKQAGLALAGTALLFQPFGKIAFASEEEDAWNKLSAEKKKSLEKLWAEFKKKSPEEQEELKRGISKYRNLNEEQKDFVNQAYSRWKELSPEQHQAIRQKYTHWKNLSTQQKQAIRDHVKSALENKPAK